MLPEIVSDLLDERVGREPARVALLGHSLLGCLDPRAVEYLEPPQVEDRVRAVLVRLAHCVARQVEDDKLAEPLELVNLVRK